MACYIYTYFKYISIISGCNSNRNISSSVDDGSSGRNRRTERKFLSLLESYEIGHKLVKVDQRAFC